MQTDLFGDDKVILNITREAHEQWRRSLLVGILLLLTGILAMLFPFATSIAAETLLGIVLLAGAVVEFVHAFRCRRWKGSLVNALTGLISLVFGALFLLYPLTGVLSLTLLLGVVFFTSGVFRLAVAFRLRPYDGWGWLMFSGIIGILLGASIALLLPHAAAWILGLMIGVDLLFAGWWLIALALSARKIGQAQ